MFVCFHHGALSDTYEEQANKQGFTFGDDAEWVEQLGKSLVVCWIHGVFTDTEYHKVIDKFQKKILLKRLRRIDNRSNDND